MKNYIFGIILAVFTLSASATIVTSTVGSFDGDWYDTTDIIYDLNDFIFDLDGETIVSAELILEVLDELNEYG